MASRWENPPGENHPSLPYKCSYGLKFTVSLTSSALKKLANEGNRKICEDLLSYRFAFKRWAVRNWLTGFKRSGPLIKGSRDSVTAPIYSQPWFFHRRYSFGRFVSPVPTAFESGHQGKMNIDVYNGDWFDFISLQYVLLNI